MGSSQRGWGRKPWRRRTLTGCHPGLCGSFAVAADGGQGRHLPPSPSGLGGIRLVPRFQLSCVFSPVGLGQHSRRRFSAVPGLKLQLVCSSAAHAFDAASHPHSWLVTPPGSGHPWCPGSAPSSQPLAELALSPPSQVSSRGATGWRERRSPSSGSAAKLPPTSP